MIAQTTSEQLNPYLRANSLPDLLSWDDVDFVRCAYVTILGRQPDPEGEAYYSDRIRRGHAKLEVLLKLRKSPEGRQHDPGISGLDRTLNKARWERNAVIGWAIRSVVGGEGNNIGWKRHRALLNRVAVIQSEQARQAPLINRVDAKLDHLTERLVCLAAADSGSADPASGSQKRRGAGLRQGGLSSELDSRSRYALGLLQLEAKFH